VAALPEGFDIVAGYREGRRDALLTRRLPSWVANRLVRCITGIAIRDTGCTFKAYRRTALERTPLYSDMHRYLPALAAATAGARIVEVPVRHRPRRFGASKYGLDRTPKVLADLVVLAMLSWFRERPLAMFGLAAAGAFVAAAAFLGASIVAFVGFREAKAAAYVLPGATLLWLHLGIYLLMLGGVAEVVLRRVRERDPEAPPLAEERAW
jgi:hypothetical protein